MAATVGTNRVALGEGGGGRALKATDAARGNQAGGKQMSERHAMHIVWPDVLRIAQYRVARVKNGSIYPTAEGEDRQMSTRPPVYTFLG